MGETTKYRCLNDLFAYCKGTPKEREVLDLTQSIVHLGNGCTKDLKTCGHYLKESEQHPTTPKIFQKSK